MPPAAKRRIWSLRRRCHATRPPRRATAHCSAENTAGLRPACFSVCAVLCCPAPGRSTLLFYPISGQKERGVIPLVLFGLFTSPRPRSYRTHGRCSLHIRWGRRKAPHLGQVVTPGVSSFHTELRRLFRRCLDTLLLGTAIYDTSLGSCPGRAKLTQTLYPTAARGQQNVDQFQACSRRVPR